MELDILVRYFFKENKQMSVLLFCLKNHLKQTTELKTYAEVVCKFAEL